MILLCFTAVLGFSDQTDLPCLLLLAVRGGSLHFENPSTPHFSFLFSSFVFVIYFFFSFVFSFLVFFFAFTFFAFSSSFLSSSLSFFLPFYLHFVSFRSSSFFFYFLSSILFSFILFSSFYTSFILPLPPAFSVNVFFSYRLSPLILRTTMITPKSYICFSCVRWHKCRISEQMIKNMRFLSVSLSKIFIVVSFICIF